MLQKAKSAIPAGSILKSGLINSAMGQIANSEEDAIYGHIPPPPTAHSTKEQELQAHPEWGFEPDYKQNTILTYLKMVLIVAGIGIFFLPGFANSEQGDTSRVGKLGISGECLGYLDNLEYTTHNFVGQTYFGGSTRLRLFYEPAQHLRFSAGFYGLRRFGDNDNFFSIAMPIFRAQYFTDHLSFMIGDLPVAGNHSMPNLVYRQEYQFDPGVQEGLQLDIHLKHFDWEIWGAWDSLLSPAHREHFEAASSAKFKAGCFSFPLYLSADHTGGEGEVFSDSVGPVKERFGGATGVEFRFPLDNGLHAVFGELLVPASFYRIRQNGGETGHGAGVFAKLGISPWGFDCSLQYFKGNNLNLPLGDPIFQSNLPVYALEISREYRIDKHIDITGGWRWETPDVSSIQQYFSTPKYRFWIGLRGDFEKLF